MNYLFIKYYPINIILNNSMNNLFLIWDIDITPYDKNIGIIKSKLNLKEMKNLAIMNQDVYNFFAGKKFCPEFSKKQKKYIKLRVYMIT